MSWKYWTGNKIPSNTAGNSFSLVSTPADLSWFGLAYGNGIWAAVADSGTNPVMTSPSSGLDWTQRTATNVRWRDLTFSPDLGLFCACSISGTFRIMTSPDGINWTDRTAASASSWFGVAWGNGYFVSCATSRVQYSTDGINWTWNPIPTGGYRCITYSPILNMWVAAGDGVIATATDPTGTWTARTGAAGLLIVDIQWAEGVFVGTDFNSNNNIGIHSSDGINWSNPTNVGVSFNRNGVAYGNNRWFIAGGVSGGGRLDESTDALNWQSSNSKLPTGITDSGYIQRIRYSDEKFIAIISGGSNGQRVLISE